MKIPELHEIENTDFVDEMSAEECFNYFRDHTSLMSINDKLAGEYPNIYRVYWITLEDGSFISEKGYVMGNKVPPWNEIDKEPERIIRSLVKQYFQHHINNSTLLADAG